MAALLTDDVVILRAHADPLMGPAQVKFFMKQRPEALRDDTWEPTSVIVAPSLDVAVERGAYRQLDPETGKYAAIGNYISAYRQEMGEWKLQSDAKWLTDMVIGDDLCRATNDGTGGAPLQEAHRLRHVSPPNKAFAADATLSYLNYAVYGFLEARVDFDRSRSTYW